MPDRPRKAAPASRLPASTIALVAPLVVALVLLPYELLALMSLGSGWTFPTLLPDRLDFAPWRHFVSARSEMLAAVATSAGMSVLVATFATVGGLLVGRFVRRRGSNVWRFAIYLPFVVSPVVAGICLYDLMVRLRLAGTIAGVILVQTVFAVGFASVFFSELWSPRVDRLQQLVTNLGGNRWNVWRHAILPQLSGLIAICFLQTMLFSWLDYGIVSTIGGGQVTSVTMRLFSYLREANVNQAAQASLVLLGPALAGFLVAGLVYSSRLARSETSDAA